jgi:agmatine deiminase
MIVVKVVEKQRNPDWTEDQIFEEYNRMLGIRKIIRLKQGMCQDEVIEKGPIPGPEGMRNAFTLLGNSGHVDAFCRFVGPQTILLAEVDPRDAEKDPISYENRIRLEENYNILAISTDADGNPFNIVRMPVTDSLYVTLTPEDSFYEYLLELNFPCSETFSDGKFPHKNELPFLLPTSYLNFIIANEVILIPKFWSEGLPASTKAKDEKAASILKSLFPDKHIISINVLNVNICGGGIHCLTQHEP